MRFLRWRGACLALFVALTLGMAGCMDGTQDGTGEPDDDGGQSGAGGPAPMDFFNDPVEENETDPPPDDETPGDERNQTQESDKECHEFDPPRPAHPDDHAVDSVGDIECAGQYAVVHAGSGPSWSVPEWRLDDWWQYRLQIVGFTACQIEEFTVIDDANEMFNQSLYTLERDRYDCDDEPGSSEPRLYERTQASLMQIHTSGYIEHEAVFPMRDGMMWVVQKGNGELQEHKASHDPAYVHDSTVYEAWHVEWEHGNEEAHVSVKATWGVDVHNLLLHEMTVVTTSGTFVVQKKLIDSSYMDDGLLGGFPFGMPQ